MSHPARLDGSQCHNYIFRHCKRLVLRLIIAHSIKSTLTHFKVLKTSNTQLKCVYHKIIYRFCLFVNVHMPGCIAGRLATARQLDSFLCIKSKAFTRSIFDTINKSGITPTFLYFGAVCIRFLVRPGGRLYVAHLITAYSTQARQKRI